MTIRQRLSSVLWGIPLAVLLGCATAGIDPIDPQSLLLPEGGRVLFFGVSRQLFGFGIDAPPAAMRLPGITVVAPFPLPSGEKWKGVDLEKGVEDLMARHPADLAVGVRPVSRILARYGPYRVFKGWKREWILDGYVRGRPVYRQIQSPVYVTRYRHFCRRITYEIYQFDASGQWIGLSTVENPASAPCPETADRDVVVDDASYVAHWLTCRLTPGCGGAAPHLPKRTVGPP